jgi:hypothetical protein
MGEKDIANECDGVRDRVMYTCESTYVWPSRLLHVFCGRCNGVSTGNPVLMKYRK